MRKYKCKVCGYIYDPLRGDSSHGVPPNTGFFDLPEYWVCPICGAGRDEFSAESAGGELPKALSDAEREALRELEEIITDAIVKNTDGEKGQRIQKPDMSEVSQEASMGQAMDLNASLGSGHGMGAGSPFEQHPLLGQKQSSAPLEMTQVAQDNAHAEEEAAAKLEQCEPQLQASLQQQLGLGRRFVPPTPSVHGR